MGVAPSKEGQFPRELKKASGETDDLLMLVGELQMKLQPMLQAVPPSPEHNSTTSGPSTDAARAVSSIGGRVARANWSFALFCLG